MIRMPKRKSTRIVGGVAVAAVALIGGWEGLKLTSYQDVIGVWTACYGETKGIGPGMKFTKGQCDAIFIESIRDHEAGMRGCLENPDAIPEESYVAFTSFTYNVGVGNFCKSTMRRKINAGDVRGACHELRRWNRAGGRVIRGLTNRRADELRLCLKGAA